MTRWLSVGYCIVLSVASSGALVAQAPAFVEPRWPQQFTLERGDHAAYGIAVGAPGAIAVRAQASGVVIVSIVRPNGTVAREMQGAGSISVDYAATREDVATGMGWRIGVRDAAVAPVKGGRLLTPSTGAVISGSLAVDHPAGDPRKVTILADRPMAAPSAFQPEMVLADLRAASARATADVRARRLAVIQPKLTPMTASAISPARKTPVTMPGKTLTGVVPTRAAGTGTSAQAVTGAGSNPPATVVTPSPAIASLDTTSGSPGQQVLVTGSGFGPTPGGEVHFMVAPGKDLPGTVTYWSDAQIVVGVPSITGVGSFAGQLYVRSGTTNSLLVPFRFEPEMDYAIIPITADRQVTGDVFGSVVSHRGWPGWRADDEFFLHTTLKNGWVLYDAYVITPGHPEARSPNVWDGRGDAYVSVAAIGSNSLRIKVHLWGEANSFYNVTVEYSPVVVARGPKGLPWQ